MTDRQYDRCTESSQHHMSSSSTISCYHGQKLLTDTMRILCAEGNKSRNKKMTGNQSDGNSQKRQGEILHTTSSKKSFIINSSFWRHNTIIIPGLHHTRNTWQRFKRDWQIHKITKGSIHKHTGGYESTQHFTQNWAFSTSEISTPVANKLVITQMQWHSKYFRHV